MIVVGTTIINYAVQFPSEGLSADYLPPAEGATATSAPAVYIVAVMRPAGAFTFNKMLAYLLAHLGIFSQGDVAARQRFNEVLEGVSPTAVTLFGYQYSLQGELVPVPRQFYNDRYLSPRPFFVESEHGESFWPQFNIYLGRTVLPFCCAASFRWKVYWSFSGPNLKDAAASFG